MPLAHLLGALERDATAEAAALAAEADARGAAIAAESDARIARRREAALGARRAELTGALELALAEARRAARGAALRARTRLLDRVFDAARGRFAGAAESPEYRAALPAQLAAALQAAGDDPAVVTGAKSLIPGLRAALPAGARAEVRADGAVGPGFRVAAADGALVVDATLAGRLEHLRPVLSIALVAALRGPA